MMKFGCALCLVITAAAVSGQARPRTLPNEVSLWVSRNVAPASRVSVTINTRNVPVLKMTASRIDGRSWFSQRESARRRPAAGVVVRQWTMDLRTRGQVGGSVDRYFSRQSNLPPLPSGTYLITASGGGREAWGVVGVTRLAVVAKTASRRSLVWVTDHRTGQPVAGARANWVLWPARTSVGAATTDRDGIALGPGLTSGVVLVSAGSDLAAVPVGAASGNGNLVAHFQTDRPIYRPGQTVSFRAIVRRTRDNAYANVVRQPVRVQLRDPRNNPIDEVNLVTSDHGTVAATFSVPQEGMLGGYTLVLGSGAEEAYRSFQVAEYRKPEFEVDAAPVQPRAFAGDTVRFRITARTFFGTPVVGGRVSGIVRRSSSGDDFPFTRGSDGNLYPRDTYYADQVVANAELTTDANGQAEIVVPTQKGTVDTVLTFTGTVIDATRRQVETSARVPVFGAAVQVSLETPESFVPLGGLIPVRVRLSDLDRKPVAGTATLTVHERRWDEKRGREFLVTLASLPVAVPASGTVIARLPARAEGVLTLTAETRDAQGRVARALTSQFVSGPFVRASKSSKEPFLNVFANPRSALPGTPIRVFATSSEPGRPMLLTVEGDDLFRWKVSSGGAAGRNWSFASTPLQSPNVSVTASVWAKSRLLSGQAGVNLPDPARRLRVALGSDRPDYRPGDPATLKVEVRDAKGRPAVAEVGLSVVDEAIFALAPDATPPLIETFWSNRPSRVTSSESAPEEVSGGAYQRADVAASAAPGGVPVRRRFEDTAAWKPQLVTGPDGQATFTFETAGNLTTWRANARAVTPATSVGEAQTKFLANRPAMLRLAVPRQWVSGDEGVVVGTVDSRVDREMRYEVVLTTADLDRLTEERQVLTVPAKGQGRVAWTVRAPAYSGRPARLTAVLRPLDAPEADRAAMSDALELRVPVVPNGTEVGLRAFGLIGAQGSLEVVVPSEAIAGSASGRLEVCLGFTALRASLSDRVLGGQRYGVPAAANQLLAAALAGRDSRNAIVREALALIARTQTPVGWGWWDGLPADANITAQAMEALVEARASRIQLFSSFWLAAIEAGNAQYDLNGLWEARARLASALARAGHRRAQERLDEVQSRGTGLSPLARLRLAEGYLALNRAQPAIALWQEVRTQVADGPDAAFVPMGEGIGWVGGDVAATARALVVGLRLAPEDPLLPKFAAWLASRDAEGALGGEDDQAAVLLAIHRYLLARPEAFKLGPVRGTVNGQEVTFSPSAVAPIASAPIPAGALRAGFNRVEIERGLGGNAQVTLVGRAFVPGGVESSSGIRVLRRWEVLNAVGVWTELDRDVRPGEPVRVTVVVWGDGLDDAIRVVQPIPSGFEYVDTEIFGGGREEVRDGAVVSYLPNATDPITLRVVLRAESDGKRVGLATSAGYLRRPTTRGISRAIDLVVREQR